jgi:hypothetical protein
LSVTYLGEGGHHLARVVVRTERWITLCVACVEIKKMLKGAFFLLIVSDTVSHDAIAQYNAQSVFVGFIHSLVY